MERGEIQAAARQRKETETAPPLSVSISHLCLSSPDSALLHPGYCTMSGGNDEANGDQAASNDGNGKPSDDAAVLGGNGVPSGPLQERLR
jgi:hypothetical protein